MGGYSIAQPPVYPINQGETPSHSWHKTRLHHRGQTSAHRLNDVDHHTKDIQRIFTTDGNGRVRAVHGNKLYRRA